MEYELDMAEDWEKAQVSAREIAQKFGVRLIAEVERGPGGGNPNFRFAGARKNILELAKFWER